MRLRIAGVVLIVAVMTLHGRAQEAPAAAPPPAPTPAPDSTTGSVTVGVGSVDGLDESSKAQQFREIPNGFFLQQLTFGAATKSAWTFELQAIDLLQDDQRIDLGIRKPGTLNIHVRYDQIPNWYSNTAATLFANAGGGRMLFPTPIRQEIQSTVPASGIGPILDSSLAAAQPYPYLRSRRDTASGDLAWSTPVQGLTFSAGYLQEQRNGTHPLSMSTNFSVGSDITEFAGRTDFTSREARIGLDFAKSRFDVGGSIVWSEFTNGLTSATGTGTLEDAYIVDNPLRATDGTPAVPDPAAPNNLAAARLFLSAPPDTRAAWVNLHAGVRIADWGRASLEYAVGQNRQDERFLPFTLNSAIVPPTPLVILEDGSPVDRYDGSIDITRWDARVNGHPLRWLSFEAFAHDYHYDNNTPHYDIPDWVNTDVALAGVAVTAEPFAYETLSYGGRLTFRPLQSLSLGVGAGRETWDREFRFTPTTDEDLYDVSVGWTPAAWGNVRLAYGHGKRRFDEYEEDVPTNPAGLREFDLADRDRDRYELMANFTPLDRLQLGVQAHSIEDEYPSTTFGRTSDKMDGWAVDFAVDAGAGITVSGDYGQDRFRWSLASRYRAPGTDDPLDDWFTDTDDDTQNYGLGVNAQFASGKVILDVHGNVTDATGEQTNTFVPGGQANSNGGLFPDVVSKLTILEAAVTWKLRPSLLLGFALTVEDWNEDNFQLDVMEPWMGGVDPATSESVFLGARVPGYDLIWARVLLSYSF